MSEITNGQTAEAAALLKARCTCLWVDSPEEARPLAGLIEAAGRAKLEPRIWDCYAGLRNILGQNISPEGEVLQAPPKPGTPDDLRNPLLLLGMIETVTDRCLYILKDFHKVLDNTQVERGLKNVVQDIQLADLADARAVAILTTSSDIPESIAAQTVSMTWPLPEREEIATALDEIVKALSAEDRDAALAAEDRDAAIEAAVGLTLSEAENCFARSMVKERRIDPRVVAVEKKKEIEKDGTVSWFEPEEMGLDAIGGLDLYKQYTTEVADCFGQDAREFGLPAPRGVLLVGVSGCGKSLSAKATAAAFGIPLLRADLGAMKTELMGGSEKNIRKLFAIADRAAPCVLWIDEIEKALGGASGPSGDSGVAKDQLATILNWMQEKQGAVYVIATANQVEDMPPEMLRKGRFDEVFFVDLPTSSERREIIAVSARKLGRDPETLGDLDAAVRATEGFAGAEIAGITEAALRKAFRDDQRELRAEDIVEAAETTVPLSKTAKEKIDELRAWADTRARNASTPETVTDTDSSRRRAIDY